ncbi:hypothetical protein F8M41_011108 [Gigaspora margarita]|uniref:Uncharacterized protein n=1 Tax=Gigaspora margarita TaxID=4874 RepID=A0A8H4A2Q5_GIGMA|nr:hypothetical protein F8M41_011108 [Gigaspora margarita]
MTCIKNTQNRIASFQFIIKNRNQQIVKLLSESGRLTSQHFNCDDGSFLIFENEESSEGDLESQIAKLLSESGQLTSQHFNDDDGSFLIFENEESSEDVSVNKLRSFDSNSKRRRFSL